MGRLVGVARSGSGPDPGPQPVLAWGIYQKLCLDNVRPARAVRPLAGGKPQNELVRHFNPALGRFIAPEDDLNTSPSDAQMGTPSQQSGVAS